MVRGRSATAPAGGELDQFSLRDLDEIDLLLTELKISQGRGNLILCTVASPAYREKVIRAIKERFSSRIILVEKGDRLISDLRSMRAKGERVLIWVLPETLSKDILDAINNFRELFYEAGVPSLIFLTPAALDDVIWQAPDFWRYRGGFHRLKGQEGGPAFQAVEALSIPMSFSYQNKEELLRRKRINEHLLEKVKDKRAQGNALSELGIIHSLLGEVKKAIEYHEQALAIAREIGDRRGEGNALGNLGLAYAALGEARKAIDYYEQHLAIAREIGDKRGEGAALGNLGLAYAALGDARNAIEYHEQALAIDREIGDRRGERVELGGLGNAYAALGDARNAIEHYEQALVIAREIGDRRGEGNTLFNMSQALDTLGQRSEAVECAKAALQIFEQIESPHAEQVRQQLAQWQG
jgi:tetratricopeptide (TPR) repeat protein